MLGKYAWYSKNTGGFLLSRRTRPVGEKKPDGLGLYDMTGNVWEWVSDWYRKEYYKNSIQNNPKGPEKGTLKILRGGSLVDGQ